MHKFSTYLLLGTALSAAFFSAEANARRQLVPDKPSIEINLDVVEALRARNSQGRVASAPFARGASPAVQKRQPRAVARPAAPRLLPRPVAPAPAPAPVQVAKTHQQPVDWRRAPEQNKPVSVLKTPPLLLPPPPAPKSAGRFAMYELAKPEPIKKAKPVVKRKKTPTPKADVVVAPPPPPPLPAPMPKIKAPVVQPKVAAPKVIAPPKIVAKPKSPPVVLKPLPEPEIANIEFEEFPKLEPLPEIEAPKPKIIAPKSDIPPMPALEDIPPPEVLPPFEPIAMPEPLPLPVVKKAEEKVQKPTPVMPELPPLESAAPDIYPSRVEMPEPEVIAAPIPPMPVPEVIAPVVPELPPMPELEAMPAPDMPIAPMPDMPEIGALSELPDLPDTALLSTESPKISPPPLPSALPSLEAITGEPDETVRTVAAPIVTEPSVMVADAPMEDFPVIKMPQELPDISAMPEGLPDMPLMQMPELEKKPALPEPKLVASLKPEPKEIITPPLPKAEPAIRNAKKNMDIIFSQTENEIPVSAKAELDKLSEALKKSGSVTIRPYVGMTEDGAQLANVIGTRRAFAVRTYLIDKGVSHFNISIDRNQPTASGSPERVELIVR